MAAQVDKSGVSKNGELSGMCVNYSAQTKRKQNLTHDVYVKSMTYYSYINSSRLFLAKIFLLSLLFHFGSALSMCGTP